MTSKQVITRLSSRLPLRALVADDHRVNRLFLSTALGHLGVACETADSGTAAVAAADRSQFELLMLDFHMPEMSGLDAIGVIRRRPGMNAFTYAVATTADVDGASRDRLLAGGFNEILEKPFSPYDLAHLLSRLTQAFEPPISQ